MYDFLQPVVMVMGKPLEASGFGSDAYFTVEADNGSPLPNLPTFQMTFKAESESAITLGDLCATHGPMPVPVVVHGRRRPRHRKHRRGGLRRMVHTHMAFTVERFAMVDDAQGNRVLTGFARRRHQVEAAPDRMAGKTPPHAG